MSKSKYGDSNLYMTTREFADLVVEALNEQKYFKHDEVAHPQDIAYAFSTVGETIGSALYWAIKQEHESNKKNAVMQTGNLKKSMAETLNNDESSPVFDHTESLAYSEWKNKSYL
jgi:hypothetical protein